MDKIVFDIETKNSFEDVGGKENIKDLEVSVIGVYSYNQDRFFCFDENEMDKAADAFRNSYLTVGFSNKRFDIPVLEKYFSFNVWNINTFDILEEIEKRMNRRIGLDLLAQANLGTGKTGHGLEAIELYHNREIGKLKEYCLNDVKITKDIYELIKNQNYLWIPQRYSPEMIKLEIDYKEKEPPAQARLL